MEQKSRVGHKYNLKFYLTIIFGVAVLITFFLPASWASQALSIFNIFRFILILAFIGLVWSNNPPVNLGKSVAKMPRSAKILSVAIPFIILSMVIIQVSAPSFATWLVRCESVSCGINFRHAIFIKAAFELVAFSVFVTLFAKFAKRKQFWPALVLGLLALAALMLAGEELSWGQRIFYFATPDAISSVNAQHEFNLHDMATQLFQNTWYFFSWLLLVAIPFLREPIVKFLSKTKKFAFLVDFIPPTYFVLIFAAAFGLGDPVWAGTGIRYSSLLFILFGTAAILIYLIIPAREQLAEKICLTLGIFTVTVFANLFLSRVWDYNSGAPGEYLELFLAFGIMYWAFYVRRNLISKRDVTKKEPDFSIK